MARRAQSLFDLEIVFEDSVVDDHEAAATVRVRVRVVFGRAPMRRPPGVADADRAGHRLVAERRLERLDPADRAPNLKPATIENRDTRGIVTAILEALQAIHDDADRALVTDVADDAAHTLTVLLCLPGPPGAVAGAPARGPLVLHRLLTALDGKSVGGHVLGDRRSRADVRPVADGDRRDQACVGADERIVADFRLVFLEAIVVARDRAGAHVHAVADRRVTEICEVVGLRAAPHARLFQLDEIPDVRLRADVRLGPQVTERAEDGLVFD